MAKTEETYTLAEIKKAFWGNFHECGEIFFSYLGDDESNEASTDAEWSGFSVHLESIKPQGG